MIYVGLEFLSLWSRRQALQMRGKAFEVRVRQNANTGGTSGPEDPIREQQAELYTDWVGWYEDIVVNLGYAPLTVHWSLYQGLWTSQVWTGVFGTVACMAGVRSRWRQMAVA